MTSVEKPHQRLPQDITRAHEQNVSVPLFQTEDFKVGSFCNQHATYFSYYGSVVMLPVSEHHVPGELLSF